MWTKRMRCRLLNWPTACSLVFLLAATHGQVDPSTIVADVNTDCPVPNVLYTPDEFTVDRLFSLMTPLVTEGTNNSPCARQVPNLASCASDGSLQVKKGCCSKDCASKLEQAVVTAGPGCYREFIEVMCNSSDIRQSVSPVLFNAARRCLGLNPACDLLAQRGALLPPAFAARVLGSSNASNTTAGLSSNSTAGVNVSGSSGLANSSVGGNASSSSSSSMNASDTNRSRMSDSYVTVRSIGAVPDTGMHRRTLRSSAYLTAASHLHRSLSAAGDRRQLQQFQDLRAIFQNAGFSKPPSASPSPSPSPGPQTPDSAGTAASLNNSPSGNSGDQDLRAMFQGSGSSGQDSGSPGPTRRHQGADSQASDQRSQSASTSEAPVELEPGQIPPDLYPYTIPNPKDSLVLATPAEILAAAGGVNNGTANGTQTSSTRTTTSNTSLDRGSADQSHSNASSNGSGSSKATNNKPGGSSTPGNGSVSGGEGSPAYSGPRVQATGGESAELARQMVIE